MIKNKVTDIKNTSTESHEEYFKSEIKYSVSNQLKVFSSMAFLMILSLLLYGVYFKQSELNQILIGGIAGFTSLIVFAIQFTGFGKSKPVLMSHILKLGIIISFSVSVYIYPGSLQLYSIVLGLLILAGSIILNWNYLNQIIVAIYLNLLFVGGITYKYLNGFEPSAGDFQFIIILMAFSVLALVASTIIFKLRKKLFIKKSEVEESDQKYKDIFENSAEGIFRCKLEGAFIMLNPAIVRMLGYENVDEILSQNFFNDFLHSSREAETLKKMLQKQKELKNYRVRLKRKDKSEIIVRAHLRLIVNEFDSNNKHIDGSIQNITQQVIAENERQKALNELRKAKIQSDVAAHKAQEEATFKTMYLANMSHEIRTPINAVIGALDIIKNGMYKSNEELQGLTRSAKLSADTMLEILNNILDLSKIEAGRMELDQVEFDIREEINKALSIVSTNAKEKSIGLSYHIEEKLPQILKGDPFRYRQVLLNLLSNAIKYTDRGEVLVTVKVAGIKDNKIKFVTAVRDSGKGIPEDKIGDLFIAFSQIREKGDKRDGTGLGLVISQEFVKLMGGRIEVDSKAGVGSRFRYSAVMGFEAPPENRVVTGPYPKPEPKEIKEEQPQLHQEQPSPPEEIIKPENELEDSSSNYTEEIKSEEEKISTEATAKGYKPENLIKDEPVKKEVPKPENKQKYLLLVEDNPISQQLEVKILTEIGYRVKPVSNGKEALQALEIEMFDLILMDVEMPEMDGLTATKTIRKNREFDTVPIIAVTAHSSMKDREKCLNAGMDDYMAKPISVHFLRLIIDKWLKQGREAD